jgi:hypothetical protein
MVAKKFSRTKMIPHIPQFTDEEEQDRVVLIFIFVVAIVIPRFARDVGKIC